MPKPAFLSNYLWIQKESVTGRPEDFAPEWIYEIPLLKTPEGRMAQQQIIFIRDQASAEGVDPDDLITALTEADHLTIKNYADVGAWWALNAGNLGKVKDLLARLKLDLKDKRSDAPWAADVAKYMMMEMKPKPEQEAPFAKWYAAEHGIFHAAPAFGKTFIMIWSLLMRKQTALLLTHTDNLADQFITRFRHGSPDPKQPGKYFPITNCADVEAALNRPIIGRFRDEGDVFPVTVATWQSFLSAKGKASAKALAKSFGYVLCDEAHVFAAPAPAGVVNAFHARVKVGVTATPERKDKLDIALYDVIGPVTAKGVSKQVPVTAYMTATGCTFKGAKFPGKAEWARLLNWLSKQEDRNKLITDWIETDVAAGRKVLVLSDRVSWTLEMAEHLTKKLHIPSKAVTGGMSSKKGVEERNRTIQMMMDDRIQVICATQVFKLGVDIPVLDTLYATHPMNNSPLLAQMLGRIRREHPGKQRAIFRYFVDGGSPQLYGCARGTQKHLTEHGCDIVLVAEGRKPDEVMMTNNNGIWVPAEGKASGLKKATSRNKGALTALFDDLQAEKGAGEYHRKMRGTP